jgi:hypothetical protein
VTPPGFGAEGADRPLLDLDRLVAGIRWRRRLVGALALVGFVLGAATATVLPSRASADASIYVVHENEGSGDGQSLMKTDLGLLQTSTVAEVALRSLAGTSTVEQFLTTYSGAIAADNILTVTARAGDDAHALAAVQAVADAFIAIHVGQSRDATDAEVKAYNDRRDQVQRDLDGVNSQIATAGGAGAAQVQALLDRRSVLASQVSDLQQQAATASIGSPQVAAGTKIIDAPHRTSRSPLVSLALYGGLGLGLGIALGFVLAAVAAVVRDRPLLRRDIAHHLGASVIAQVQAPLSSLHRLVRRSSGETERRRVAATLVRLIAADNRPVSLLEIGCVQLATELVRDMAEELGAERPVRVVNDLPVDEPAALLAAAAAGTVELVPGAQFPSADPSPEVQPVRQLSIAGVGPGTRWTDLRRLAGDALLIVRAGSAEATWLHTVARQLADAEIFVLGVVVVHPDPRDRSDGTLWDALHTALRGRAGLRPVGEPSAMPAVESVVPVAPLPMTDPVGQDRAQPALEPELHQNGHRPSPTPFKRPRIAPGEVDKATETERDADVRAEVADAPPVADEPPVAAAVEVGDGSNGHGQTLRSRNGRRPKLRSRGGAKATPVKGVPAGPNSKATDNSQPVVPSTPADHVEAT